MKRILKFRAWDVIAGKMFYDVQPFGACWNAIVSKGGTGEEFSGLTDKNGKEIYEGDIAIYCNEKGIVQFIKGSFTLVNGNGECLGYEEEFTIGHCEVIGNIHENPDLTNN